MKVLFNILPVITSLLVISIVGLFLTKHLIVVSEQRMVTVVNDNGDPLFQMATNATEYKIVFVK